MDRALLLTFNLLLTLLVKLSVVSFFFSKRKRQTAITVALLTNMITWIIGTIVWLKLAETAVIVSNEKIFDINMLYIRIAACIAETVAYWFFLGRNWKKAVLMAVVTNVLCYLAIEYIQLPEGFFQRKDNLIR